MCMDQNRFLNIEKIEKPGSKYGYPGGSAWCVMLWCFCMWLDHASQPHIESCPPTVDEVVWRFFTVLALWPWPLPWTLMNMVNIVERKHVDGTALECSMGRHLSTSFVVPLPSCDGCRVWNMTQCVQQATQQTLLIEAWRAATVRMWPYEPYRHEMREMLCHRQSSNGDVLIRWPVYLSVTLPEASPAEWRGIFGSRLMSMLLPQLQACGFFPRPLCVDNPSYVLLLWPIESMWAKHSQSDIVLPLEERILPCLFAMVESAYTTLWGFYDKEVAPPLSSLLPELDVHLWDP